MVARVVMADQPVAVVVEAQEVLARVDQMGMVWVGITAPTQVVIMEVMVALVERAEHQVGVLRGAEVLGLHAMVRRVDKETQEEQVLIGVETSERAVAQEVGAQEGAMQEAVAQVGPLGSMVQEVRVVVVVGVVRVRLLWVVPAVQGEMER